MVQYVVLFITFNTIKKKALHFLYILYLLAHISKTCKKATHRLSFISNSRFLDLLVPSCQFISQFCTYRTFLNSTYVCKPNFPSYNYYPYTNLWALDLRVLLMSTLEHLNTFHTFLVRCYKIVSNSSYKNSELLYLIAGLMTLTSIFVNFGTFIRLQLEFPNN